MNLGKLLYRKYLRVSTSNGNDRSTLPFQITLGHNEVIQLRRVVFYIENRENTIDVSVARILAAISSSDLDVESSVEDLTFVQRFMDRNDLIVTHSFHFSKETTIHDLAADMTVWDFEEGMLLLPRSPSAILMTEINTGNDNYSLGCTIYYQKLKVSAHEMLMLMKKYKSFKAQTIPRVIDE